ncbi:hypothetical protein VB776_07355 [Arcicella sp. DC2W]|uniref:Uncharacterized protein n=1 Tax=Arcicella gelida TaxID=2984195 RepID=A0ABU5S2K4_9BACT|nr:hypothetical protein [Arcicella sp. DC2W]MEA5402724.1 hypothetical protein [Arcicella sp. DC2W]
MQIVEFAYVFLVSEDCWLALQPTLEAKDSVGPLKMALQIRKKKSELVHHRNDDSV